MSECEFDDFKFILPLKEHLTSLDQIFLPSEMLQNSPEYYNVYSKAGVKGTSRTMQFLCQTLKPSQFLNILSVAKEHDVSELIFDGTCLLGKFTEWQKFLVFDKSRDFRVSVRSLSLKNCSFEDSISVWSLKTFCSSLNVAFNYPSFKISNQTL